MKIMKKTKLTPKTVHIALMIMFQAGIIMIQIEMFMLGYINESISSYKVHKVNQQKIIIDTIKIKDLNKANKKSESDHAIKQMDEESDKFSDEDKYLLCKIAQAEAGNQSKETKKYVMMTVINRKESSEFPNTIKDVIYQDGQFSPISNGTFDLNEPTQECWDALEEVEQSKDNAYGCLYFESCSNGNSWHSRNLKYLFQSDAIRFYK